MKEEELIIKYTPIISHIAKKYTNNVEDFKDLKQELYIKLLECLKKYDKNKGVPIEAFISICCNNKAISILNKEKSYIQNMLYLDDFESEISEEIDKTTSQEAELVYKYFKELYPKHKYGIIAKLKYIDGYDTKFIAEKKGISRRAINKRIEEFNKWFKKTIEGEIE